MKKIIMLVLVAATLQQSFAQSNDNSTKQRLINVSGSAEMEIVPDEIYVQVALREYNKKGGGKTDIETIGNNFIKAATGLGIADSNIVVESYAGWDGNYWWYKKNNKKNPGLMAGIVYLVKLSSTKKMDELVTRLDDEATERFGIARVSHSNLPALKKQLKIEAVKAAREKAGYLAAAINEKVGQALIINDPAELGDFPHPMYSNMIMKEAMDGNAAPEANINFKKMKLQFEVSITFALL